MDTARVTQYLHSHQIRTDIDKDVFAGIEPIDCGDYCHLESASESYKNFSQIDVYADKIVCKSGCRGQEENKLNEFINCPVLEKNCVYVVDDITYKTDFNGRVYSVETKLPINEDINKRPAGGKEIRKHLKNKSAIKADEAGHLISREKKGPNEAINIVPMDKALNKGLYKYVDMFLSQFKGCSIEWKELLHYEGDSFRPDFFEISCFVDGGCVIEAKLYNSKQAAGSATNKIKIHISRKQWQFTE